MDTASFGMKLSERILLSTYSPHSTLQGFMIFSIQLRELSKLNKIRVHGTLNLFSIRLRELSKLHKIRVHGTLNLHVDCIRPKISGCRLFHVRSNLTVRISGRNSNASITMVGSATTTFIPEMLTDLLAKPISTSFRLSMAPTRLLGSHQSIPSRQRTEDPLQVT